MHRYRRTLGGALAAVVLTLAAGCGGDDGGGTGTTAADDGGDAGAVDNDPDAVLRVIGTNTPQLLDPVRGVSRCDVGQLAPLYDTLVRTDAEGNLVPGLAAEWSAPDPETVGLTLQSGVTFQDGTPFDAEAVRQHLERAKTDPESTITAAASIIDTVEVVDATHLVLHLGAPRAGIVPALLTDRLGMVPSPAAIEASGSAAYGTSTAVGAGPYRFVSAIPNDSLVLERWDGYWQPATQLLGGIDFGGAASEFQVERIVSGEVDYATLKDADFPLVEDAANAGDVGYQLTPSTQYTHIFVDPSKAPYDDVRVRQALLYALDRDLLNETITSGAGTVAHGPISPLSWAHSPDVDDLYPYDPDRARELLAEAGHPDGITLEMASIQSPYWERLALAVQDMLAESGITVEFTPVIGAEIQNALYVRKEFAAAVTAWAGPSDPGINLEQRWSSTGANNPSGAAYPGIDELLAEGAATADQDARAAAYQEAESLIMQQALEIPIFFNSGLTVYDPKVHNVVRGATGCGDNNFLTPPVYVAAD